MPFQKRFLKISDACEYLSVSLSKITRDINSGKIPTIRIGISIRVDKIRLDEMIEKGETAKRK